ncbi:hypothetical protein AJ80_02629 [Polytolypa hystricis UAMH7299]|uniref:Integral membrane protein n=1 Tax=Polytolypa hystricis (strain UAMH7299) TaxID=1447883 RepID=A0A2B7YP00_POLH7|nr:hypothetical protein AJ80_02629 [Polytolypa hystricis UAMH7299]
MSEPSNSAGKAHTRSRSFHPGHHPFHELLLQASSIKGPLSFLNPTHAVSELLSTAHTRKGPFESAQAAEDVRAHERRVKGEVAFKWRSRDNRKGRHMLVVTPAEDRRKGAYIVPRRTNSLRSTLVGILRMANTFPYWDVSYLTAIIFTFGSVIWVLNSFFVWLPLVDPSTEFKNEILSAGGITAFVGATIFEFGSFFLILEAINKHSTGCFGWALERVVTGAGEELLRFYPDQNACSHHHANQKNLAGRGIPKETIRKSGILTIEGKESPAFQWVPSLKEVRTHYIFELGFLASAAQLIGATVFWISGFTALPGINNHLSQPLADGVYRAPQIIGGCGFIVSGALFMLETQPNWYTPALDTLGWHIGFWNFIGAIGFTLSGIFLLPYNSSGMQYQASLSTFWGSWAFLIGSVIQWYESLDKYPVEQRSPSKPES